MVDKKRTQFFQELGFKVIRFWSDEVLTETDAVLEHILRMCVN